MKIIRLTDTNQEFVLRTALKVLSSGGLIIYPTETCYGVGVDATNQKAVNKMLTYKERPEGKAISIAVSDMKMASRYVRINSTAKNIYTNFLPGPITVISTIKEKNIAKGIASEDKSLGIRVPDYPLILHLLSEFNKPITATSANLSGRKTPYSINDILDNASLKNKKLIDLIIDAGELPHNPPSTIVDTRMNDEKILRKGTITKLIGKDSIVKKKYTSKSAKETIKIGEQVTSSLLNKLKNQCIIFALSGELGAGKTQFAKGIGKAVGVKEKITSPTFILIKEYNYQSLIAGVIPSVNKTLYHIDTWRMQGAFELTDLGFKYMIKPGNIIIIEWIEKIQNLVQTIAEIRNTHLVLITIEDTSETLRTISIKE